MEIREHKSDPMLFEEEIIKNLKENSSKQRLEKIAFVAEAYDIYLKCKKLKKKKLNYWIREKRRKNREEARLNRMYCNPSGEIYKIKKDAIRQEQKRRGRQI